MHSVPALWDGEHRRIVGAVLSNAASPNAIQRLVRLRALRAELCHRCGSTDVGYGFAECGCAASWNRKVGWMDKRETTPSTSAVHGRRFIVTVALPEGDVLLNAASLTQ